VCLIQNDIAHLGMEIFDISFSVAIQKWFSSDMRENKKVKAKYI
jgi:hypothetical protein